MKNKDRKLSTLTWWHCSEPIYRLLIQMSLISPIRVISTLSERQNGKSYFIIFYQYRDFFTVKMVVKPMTDWFKIKDVEFFSIRECTGDVYSNKLVPVSSHISSMELFKQMTFAGRRVCQRHDFHLSLLGTPQQTGRRMCWTWWSGLITTRTSTRPPASCVIRNSMIVCVWSLVIHSERTLLWSLLFVILILEQHFILVAVREKTYWKPKLCLVSFVFCLILHSAQPACFAINKLQRRYIR